MWFFILVIIVVVAVIYFKRMAQNMEEDSHKSDKILPNLAENPLTKQLQAILIDQFGDFNGEEIDKLRRLAGTGRAGYIMDVECKGLLFTLINRKGETLDKWSITFDSLGFENLPNGCTAALKKILLETLSNIPHLTVLDTGFFMYNQNRAKQSW